MGRKLFLVAAGLVAAVSITVILVSIGIMVGRSQRPSPAAVTVVPERAEAAAYEPPPAPQQPAAAVEWDFDAECPPGGDVPLWREIDDPEYGANEVDPVSFAEAEVRRLVAQGRSMTEMRRTRGRAMVCAQRRYQAQSNRLRAYVARHVDYNDPRHMGIGAAADATFQCVNGSYDVQQPLEGCDRAETELASMRH